jgi:hypothetical protein
MPARCPSRSPGPPSATSRSPATPPAFLRGDADASGERDITDAIATPITCFAGGPAPSCADAEDANDDGSLDLSDAVSFLGYLFLTGEKPPPPI